MPAVSIDINLFWQIINFIILMFIFKKYFYKPISGFLEKRKEHITNDLVQAKAEREAAAASNKKADSHLKTAKREAQKIIAKAEKKADERKEQILKETNSTREKMMKSAEFEIAKMKEQARRELQIEVTELAVILAEEMIKEKMNSKLESDLLDQFIDEVGEVK
jgi:F-type H+-transporting ATPase subunit b